MFEHVVLLKAVPTVVSRMINFEAHLALRPAAGGLGVHGGGATMGGATTTAATTTTPI
jgi:hypothetical protein